MKKLVLVIFSTLLLTACSNTSSNNNENKSSSSKSSITTSKNSTTTTPKPNLNKKYPGFKLATIPGSKIYHYQTYNHGFCGLSKNRSQFKFEPSF